MFKTIRWLATGRGDRARRRSRPGWSCRSRRPTSSRGCACTSTATSTRGSWSTGSRAGRRRRSATLRHVGRTSGAVHLTPVHPTVRGDALLIPAPLGAGSQWARNVLHAGAAEPRPEGDAVRARPTRADHGDRGGHGAAAGRGSVRSPRLAVRAPARRRQCPAASYRSRRRPDARAARSTTTRDPGRAPDGRARGRARLSRRRRAGRELNVAGAARVVRAWTLVFVARSPSSRLPASSSCSPSPAPWRWPPAGASGPTDAPARTAGGAPCGAAVGARPGVVRAGGERRARGGESPVTPDAGVRRRPSRRPAVPSRASGTRRSRSSTRAARAARSSCSTTVTAPIACVADDDGTGVGRSETRPVPRPREGDAAAATARWACTSMFVVDAGGESYSVLVGQYGSGGVRDVAANFDADAAWYTAAARQRLVRDLVAGRGEAARRRDVQQPQRGDPQLRAIGAGAASASAAVERAALRRRARHAGDLTCGPGMEVAARAQRQVTVSGARYHRRTGPPATGPDPHRGRRATREAVVGSLQLGVVAAAADERRPRDGHSSA